MKNLRDIIIESILDDDFTSKADDIIAWDKYLSSPQALADTIKSLKNNMVGVRTLKKNQRANKWTIGGFFGSYANILVMSDGEKLWEVYCPHRSTSKLGLITNKKRAKARFDQFKAVWDLPESLEYIKRAILSHTPDDVIDDEYGSITL